MVAKADSLKGKKVAVLVTDGFEQSEMVEPRRALEAAGAECTLVSPKPDKVTGWKDGEWGDAFKVDLPLDRANADDFDALLLPGGVMSPDKLRMNPAAVEFVRRFCDTGKPIGAICHGPWTLIEADCIRGLTLTSYPSLRTDLTNAGANWIDQEVVTDNGIVTSRNPDDIPAFNRKLVEEIAEGIHHNRAVRSTRAAAATQPAPR